MKKRTLWLLVVLPLLVALTYWLLPDYTRKALIHRYADVDDHLIFTNDTVRALHPHPLWHLPHQVPPPIGEEIMDSILEYRPLSFLVFHKDTLLYERYFDDHSATSISNTFSVSKSIVALLTAIALEQGYISSLDDPVRQFLPEFTAESPGRALTVRHLLEMSTGLEYQEQYTSPFGATTRSYYGSDIARQMFDLGFREEPGNRYDYVGAGTQLLAMVVERATGTTLASWAEKQLWGRIQAEHTALWSKDRSDGMVKAFCCFTATSRDLARIGRLVCHDGIWNGDTLVNPEMIRLMTTPSAHLQHEGAPVDFYGLQWWIADWQHYSVKYARGIRGQYIITIPELQLIIVRLGHTRSDIYIGEHPSDLFLYIRTALRLISDQTPE